jgi:hypothetical protein
MKLILNREKNSLNIDEGYILKIKTDLDKFNAGKKREIPFDDLRLFFEDDAITEYDTQSDGFIHQFLIEQGYEVKYD